MTRPPAKCIVLREVWRQEYKMHRAGWGPGTRVQNADTCVSKEPKYKALDGEATECRLCKHCGCMLNTDYIWLRKSSSSEKIDPHVDLKQEINFAWPNYKTYPVKLPVLHMAKASQINCSSVQSIVYSYNTITCSQLMYNNMMSVSQEIWSCDEMQVSTKMLWDIPVYQHIYD